jgi:hypothetical protein
LLSWLEARQYFRLRPSSSLVPGGILEFVHKL